MLVFLRCWLIVATALVEVCGGGVGQWIEDFFLWRMGGWIGASFFWWIGCFGIVGVGDPGQY